MAFLSKSLDVFWNGLDTTLHTLIPERILNILAMLQPAFNFTASKFVVIKDWRLGVILRLLQVAILIYIFVSIFQQASYLETEVPTGVLSPYVQAGNRSEKLDQFRIQRDQAEELTYCTGDSSAYDFSYNGQSFKEFRCMYSDVSSLSKKGESRFFVTTYIATDKTAYFKVPDDLKSCNIFDGKPEGYNALVPLNNTCVYFKRESFFPLGVEAAKLNLLHGFSTSIVEINDYLPKTHVRNPKSGKEKKFSDGEVVSMTIGDWLTIANIDLDKRMDQQEDFEAADGQTGDGNYTDKYPMVRVSGVSIIANLNYYQRKLAPMAWKKSTGKKSTDIICVMEITPRYGWSLQGSDIRHMINGPESPIFLSTDGLAEADENSGAAIMQVDFQNFGIEFSFQTGGRIGRFQLSALINALVAGSVMLSVAQAVVTIVALYGMGLSSQLYMEFMRESVDWRKEYARFAAQALVAGYAFMGYDENNSFKLDRKEVFKTLKLILGQRLPEDKLAALADFVMRQGEEDSKVSKGAFRLEKGDMPASNLISIEEWIGIFTQEKVSLAALERLIDNEYKDVRTRDFLVRAAHGVRMRGLPGEDEDGDGEEEDEHEDDVDPEILAYQQSAKRRMTQAFLANMQQGPTGRSDGPDVENGGGPVV